MKWFKHGSNMRNDAKLRRVINRYGLEGYGLYNLIVESIVESLDTDSPIPILEENIEDIAEFYHSNTSRIEEMLHFMVNQKLFDFTDNKEIICIKVFKHLQSSQTRSEALRRLISNYNENKPNLIESNTVLDSLLHVIDKDENGLNDNTYVLDNCEEEKRLEENENIKEEKQFTGFKPSQTEPTNLDKIINHWNIKENLPHCRFGSLNLSLSDEHTQVITHYTQEEIIKAIDNYSNILINDPESFPMRYKEFKSFLQKGVVKFCDEAMDVTGEPEEIDPDNYYKPESPIKDYITEVYAKQEADYAERKQQQ